MKNIIKKSIFMAIIAVCSGMSMNANAPGESAEDIYENHVRHNGIFGYASHGNWVAFKACMDKYLNLASRKKICWLKKMNGTQGTILHYAAQAGHTGFVQNVFAHYGTARDHAVWVNMLDKDNNSPLELLLTNRQGRRGQGSRTTLAELLVLKGARCNSVPVSQDDTNATYLDKVRAKIAELENPEIGRAIMSLPPRERKFTFNLGSFLTLRNATCALGAATVVVGITKPTLLNKIAGKALRGSVSVLKGSASVLKAIAQGAASASQRC